VKYKTLASVSTESVKKNTKKDWDQWITILDKTPASSWTHQELVAFLKKKHKLSVWWQQVVARGYQVAKGLRVEGQTLNGQYSVTLTKSLSIPAKNVWQTSVSREGLAAWLKPMGEFEIRTGSQFEVGSGIFGELRTLTKGHKLRLSWVNEEWEKKTTVEFRVYPRPKNKSMIVITHGNLLSARDKASMREQWQTALRDLLKVLENGRTKK
jgi:uncharacterized protein YndB with AHSA1/START domain